MRKRRTPWKIVLLPLATIALIYMLLLIPDGPPEIETQSGGTPFLWNQDEVWASLEKKFNAARESGCTGDEMVIDAAITSIEEILLSDAPDFGILEQLIFDTAPLAAACPGDGERFIETIHRTRKRAKARSIELVASGNHDRAALYRLLYGARVAEEEILLQLPRSDRFALTPYEDVPSVCPEAVVHGVKIRSGDLLLSRGGAPTSALIARGNDFPGNFSHVALVYVDEETLTPSIIEAHIEKGVAIASVNEYLADQKLRILVLRPRPELEAMVKNPLLPHKAARASLERAKREHIAYDFAMDSKNTDDLFCSEVASSVYRDRGIKLWKEPSNMSSEGLVRWLSAFGVKHFQTEAPSDLEYDHKLKLVAEWRDHETLQKDHVDNAVVDAMLELAESGKTLEYNHWMLPIARVLKLYSAVLNLFGGIGPIPEGMNATAALKNKWYSNWHDETVQKTLAGVEKFKAENGYFPPYWKLVETARISLKHQ